MDKQKMDLESLDEINGGCHWAEAPSFKARVDFVNEMREKYGVNKMNEMLLLTSTHGFRFGNFPEIC